MSTPPKPVPETDIEALQARYEFLRDKINPEHLNYVRRHSHSQAELEAAIVSLQQQHARAFPRQLPKDERRWSDCVDTCTGV